MSNNNLNILVDFNIIPRAGYDKTKAANDVKKQIAKMESDIQKGIKSSPSYNAENLAKYTSNLQNKLRGNIEGQVTQIIKSAYDVNKFLSTGKFTTVKLIEPLRDLGEVLSKAIGQQIDFANKSAQDVVKMLQNVKPQDINQSQLRKLVQTNIPSILSVVNNQIGASLADIDKAYREINVATDKRDKAEVNALKDKAKAIIAAKEELNKGPSRKDVKRNQKALSDAAIEARKALAKASSMSSIDEKPISDALTAKRDELAQQYRNKDGRKATPKTIAARQPKIDALAKEIEKLESDLVDARINNKNVDQAIAELEAAREVLKELKKATRDITNTFNKAQDNFTKAVKSAEDKAKKQLKEINNSFKNSTASANDTVSIRGQEVTQLRAFKRIMDGYGDKIFTTYYGQMTKDVENNMKGFSKDINDILNASKTGDVTTTKERIKDLQARLRTTITAYRASGDKVLQNMADSLNEINIFIDQQNGNLTSTLKGLPAKLLNVTKTTRELSGNTNQYGVGAREAFRKTLNAPFQQGSGEKLLSDGYAKTLISKLDGALNIATPNPNAELGLKEFGTAVSKLAAEFRTTLPTVATKLQALATEAKTYTGSSQSRLPNKLDGVIDELAKNLEITSDEAKQLFHTFDIGSKVLAQYVEAQRNAFKLGNTSEQARLKDAIGKREALIRSVLGTEVDVDKLHPGGFDVNKYQRAIDAENAARRSANSREADPSKHKKLLDDVKLEDISRLLEADIAGSIKQSKRAGTVDELGGLTRSLGLEATTANMQKVAESGLYNITNKLQQFGYQSFQEVFSNLASVAVFMLGQKLSESFANAKVVDQLSKELTNVTTNDFGVIQRTAEMKKSQDTLRNTIFGVSAGFTNGSEAATEYARAMNTIGFSAGTIASNLASVANVAKYTNRELSDVAKLAAKIDENYKEPNAKVSTQLLGKAGANNVSLDKATANFQKLVSNENIRESSSIDELIDASIKYAKVSKEAAKSVTEFKTDLEALNGISLKDVTRDLEGTVNITRIGESVTRLLQIQWGNFMTDLKNTPIQSIFTGMLGGLQAMIAPLQLATSLLSTLTNMSFAKPIIEGTAALVGFLGAFKLLRMVAASVSTTLMGLAAPIAALTRSLGGGTVAVRTLTAAVGGIGIGLSRLLGFMTGPIGIALSVISSLILAYQAYNKVQDETASKEQKTANIRSGLIEDVNKLARSMSALEGRTVSTDEAVEALLSNKYDGLAKLSGIGDVNKLKADVQEMGVQFGLVTQQQLDATLKTQASYNVLKEAANQVKTDLQGITGIAGNIAGPFSQMAENLANAAIAADRLKISIAQVGADSKSIALVNAVISAYNLSAGQANLEVNKARVATFYADDYQQLGAERRQINTERSGEEYTRQNEQNELEFYSNQRDTLRAQFDAILNPTEEQYAQFKEMDDKLFNLQLQAAKDQNASVTRLNSLKIREFNAEKARIDLDNEQDRAMIAIYETLGLGQVNQLSEKAIRSQLESLNIGLTPSEIGEYVSLMTTANSEYFKSEIAKLNNQISNRTPPTPPTLTNLAKLPVKENRFNDPRNKPIEIDGKAIVKSVTDVLLSYAETNRLLVQSPEAKAIDKIIRDLQRDLITSKNGAVFTSSKLDTLKEIMGAIDFYRNVVASIDNTNKILENIKYVGIDQLNPADKLAEQYKIFMGGIDELVKLTDSQVIKNLKNVNFEELAGVLEANLTKFVTAARNNITNTNNQLLSLNDGIQAKIKANRDSLEERAMKTAATAGISSDIEKQYRSDLIDVQLEYQRNMRAIQEKKDELKRSQEFIDKIKQIIEPWKLSIDENTKALNKDEPIFKASYYKELDRVPEITRKYDKYYPTFAKTTDLFSPRPADDMSGSTDSSGPISPPTSNPGDNGIPGLSILGRLGGVYRGLNPDGPERLGLPAPRDGDARFGVDYTNQRRLPYTPDVYTGPERVLTEGRAKIGSMDDFYNKVSNMADAADNARKSLESLGDTAERRALQTKLEEAKAEVERIKKLPDGNSKTKKLKAAQAKVNDLTSKLGVNNTDNKFNTVDIDFSDLDAASKANKTITIDVDTMNVGRFVAELPQPGATSTLGGTVTGDRTVPTTPDLASVADEVADGSTVIDEAIQKRFTQFESDFFNKLSAQLGLPQIPDLPANNFNDSLFSQIATARQSAFEKVNRVLNYVVTRFKGLGTVMANQFSSIKTAFNNTEAFLSTFFGNLRKGIASVAEEKAEEAAEEVEKTTGRKVNPKTGEVSSEPSNTSEDNTGRNPGSRTQSNPTVGQKTGDKWQFNQWIMSEEANKLNKDFRTVLVGLKRKSNKLVNSKDPAVKANGKLLQEALSKYINGEPLTGAEKTIFSGYMKSIGEDYLSQGKISSMDNIKTSSTDLGTAQKEQGVKSTSTNGTVTAPESGFDRSDKNLADLYSDLKSKGYQVPGTVEEGIAWLSDMNDSTLKGFAKLPKLNAKLVGKLKPNKALANVANKLNKADLAKALSSEVPGIAGKALDFTTSSGLLDLLIGAGVSYIVGETSVYESLASLVGDDGTLKTNAMPIDYGFNATSAINNAAFGDPGFRSTLIDTPLGFGKVRAADPVANSKINDKSEVARQNATFLRARSASSTGAYVGPGGIRIDKGSTLDKQLTANPKEALKIKVTKIDFVADTLWDYKRFTVRAIAVGAYTQYFIFKVYLNNKELNAKYWTRTVNASAQVNSAYVGGGEANYADSITIFGDAMKKDKLKGTIKVVAQHYLEGKPSLKGSLSIFQKGNFEQAAPKPATPTGSTAPTPFIQPKTGTGLNLPGQNKQLSQTGIGFSDNFTKSLVSSAGASALTFEPGDQYSPSLKNQTSDGFHTGAADLFYGDSSKGGEPIPSPFNGVVRDLSGSDKVGNRNYINLVLWDKNGKAPLENGRYIARFQHVVDIKVSKNAKVKKGQIIAHEGHGGNAYHLHLELHDVQDPKNNENGPATSIINKDQWAKVYSQATGINFSGPATSSGYKGFNRGGGSEDTNINDIPSVDTSTSNADATPTDVVAFGVKANRDTSITALELNTETAVKTYEFKYNIVTEVNGEPVDYNVFKGVSYAGAMLSGSNYTQVDAAQDDIDAGMQAAAVGEKSAAQLYREGKLMAEINRQLTVYTRALDKQAEFFASLKGAVTNAIRSFLDLPKKWVQARLDQNEKMKDQIFKGAEIDVNRSSLQARANELRSKANTSKTKEEYNGYIQQLQQIEGQIAEVNTQYEMWQLNLQKTKEEGMDFGKVFGEMLENLLTQVTDTIMQSITDHIAGAIFGDGEDRGNWFGKTSDYRKKNADLSTASQLFSNNLITEEQMRKYVNGGVVDPKLFDEATKNAVGNADKTALVTDLLAENVEASQMTAKNVASGFAASLAQAAVGLAVQFVIASALNILKNAFAKRESDSDKYTAPVGFDTTRGTNRPGGVKQQPIVVNNNISGATASDVTRVSNKAVAQGMNRVRFGV